MIVSFIAYVCVGALLIFVGAILLGGALVMVGLIAAPVIIVLSYASVLIGSLGGLIASVVPRRKS